MPRAHFPHTLDDVTRAVDGPLGLVVGDLSDGSIWVLARRRRDGIFALTRYADAARSATLARREFGERREAINAMAEAIGLEERI